MQHNALPDDDRIKSRPIYVTPEHPATANYYVCVAEPDAVNLIMKHVAPIDKHRTPFHFIICADRADATPAGLPSEWQNVPLQCCDRDALSTTLATQLETLTQGCHVIVAGSEAFLWDVHTLALAHGLLDAEITLLPSADNARRVFCTHCRFMSEPVTASPTRCQGCGLTLEVRDHFSRRLGAYMGVRIDAEVPGEVPREEVFDS